VLLGKKKSHIRPKKNPRGVVFSVESFLIPSETQSGSASHAQNKKKDRNEEARLLLGDEKGTFSSAGNVSAKGSKVGRGKKKALGLQKSESPVVSPSWGFKKKKDRVTLASVNYYLRLHKRRMDRTFARGGLGQGEPGGTPNVRAAQKLTEHKESESSQDPHQRRYKREREESQSSNR